MLLATLISVATAVIAVGVALATVLAARPAARRVRTARAAQRVAKRVNAGRDWLTSRITVQLLVLVAGAAVVFALGAVFAEITEAVVDHDDLTVVDRPVLGWLAEYRTPELTQAQIGVTNLGSAVAFTITLTLTAAAVAMKLRSWRPVILTVITAGGIQAIVAAIKLIIGRPRPELADRLVGAGGFSFPSGHSAGALACFGMLAWLVCMVTRRPAVLATAWLAAALLTVAVGFSRVYLAVHYPSDVLGGWVLGGTWLLTVALAAYLAKARFGKARNRSGSPSI